MVICSPAVTTWIPQPLIPQLITKIRISHYHFIRTKVFAQCPIGVNASPSKTIFSVKAYYDNQYTFDTYIILSLTYKYLFKSNYENISMKIKGIGRIFIFLIILLVILIGVRKNFKKPRIPISQVISRIINTGEKDSSEHKPSNNLEANLYETLRKLEVKKEEITTRLLLENNVREINAAVPRGRPDEWVVWQLTQATKVTPYNVEDCAFDKKKDTYTISFTSNNTKNEKITLHITKANRFLSNTAKMAILIEDFNFEANQTTIDFLSFPEPLTIALVSHLKKSSWTAEAAKEYKKEIVIHLPFESKIKRENRPAAYAIMVHYPEEKIRTIINDAVKVIPNFTGFASMHGSLALEDSRVMDIVLNEIKKHDGYFIDTRITKNSIIPDIAAKKRIPYAEVSEQIKEKANVASLEDQLKHYAVVAQKRGKILITAKASRIFIKALTSVLPTLRQNGVQLIYVSEIVTKPE